MRDKSECFIIIHHPFFFALYLLLMHLYVGVLLLPVETSFYCRDYRTYTLRNVNTDCGIDKTSFSGQGGLFLYTSALVTF